MQLSSRIRTAVMALVALASREDCCLRPVTLSDLASGSQLSPAYLEQLFARLRRAGLVVSARGPGGGYRLARAASQMPLYEVVAALDDPEPADAECPCCQALWDGLGRHMDHFLRQVTLDDVVRRKVGKRR